MKKIFILFIVMALTLILTGLAFAEEIPEDGLIAHYDAASLDIDIGETLLNWPDLTGNFDLMQPNPNRRPKLAEDFKGRTVVRFDDDGLRTFFEKDFLQPNTIIIVFRLRDSDSYYHIFDGIDTHDRTRLVFDPYLGSTGQKLMMTNHPSSAPWLDGEVRFQIDIAHEDLTTAVCVFDDDQSLLRVNRGEYEATGYAGHTPMAGFTLSGMSEIDGGHLAWSFKDDIAEVMIYERRLSDEEIEVVEEYLYDKWHK